jgi:chromate transporter
MKDEALPQRTVGLDEITRVFLKIGAMSYGGPAIMGIMQAEIQEKRQWIAKQDFVEGLALVNMLPGPGATQLGIFLGHAKHGLLGGILAGIAFILPAFLIMLALSATYDALGAFAVARHAFYGIGPVVVGIFAVAVYRLGRGTIRLRAQLVIGIAAAMLMLLSSVGLTVTLLAAGCIGVALFHSRRAGLIALAVLAALFAGYTFAAAEFTMPAWRDAPMQGSASLDLWGLGVFFLKVGALTFGGGLSMLAFIQNQVVDQMHLLSPQEFVDGLALGQLTPGPVLMLAAFVGYKLAGVAGAAVAASAIFFPSFVMMLSVLPLLRRMNNVEWLRAFMRGVTPAVIGALAVSLAQMAPQAAPDLFTASLLILTVGVLLLRNVGPLPMVFGGAVLGVFSKTEIWERVARFAR